MNKVMGVGIAERWAYAALFPIVMGIGQKTGWYDAELAAYITAGLIASFGSGRAWWVNRPSKLMDDAAAQLPKNVSLAMVVPPHASYEDKEEVRLLNAATTDKVSVKIAG